MRQWSRRRLGATRNAQLAHARKCESVFDHVPRVPELFIQVYLRMNGRLEESTKLLSTQYQFLFNI